MASAAHHRTVDARAAYVADERRCRLFRRQPQEVVATVLLRQMADVVRVGRGHDEDLSRRPERPVVPVDHVERAHRDEAKSGTFRMSIQ